MGFVSCSAVSPSVDDGTIVEVHFKAPQLFHFFVHRLCPQQISRTETVAQRAFATKISPNFRVNLLVRFASKPLFCQVMTGYPLELFRKVFGAVRAIFWHWASFWVPQQIGDGEHQFALTSLGVQLFISLG